MLLSIITVCFNAEKTIERTFKSVFNQTYGAFEYLIIDGDSKDKTIDIINRWKEKFASTEITFKVISEKDNGLYNAMNKGARNANGDFLLYLNADDELASDDSIVNFIDNLKNSDDVLYGNAIIVNKTGSEEVRKALPANTITKHLPFIPQSAFVRTSVQRKFPFNEQYRITADYDSFLRMYLAGKNFRYVDYYYSKFYVGGISNEDEWLTYKEDIKVKHNNGILNKYSLIQQIKYFRRYLSIRYGEKS